MSDTSANDPAAERPHADVPHSPGGGSQSRRDPLRPDADQESLPPLVGRHEHRTTLVETLSQSPFAVVFLSGPHGAGKTLLLRHVLADLPDAVTTCYLSCRRYDTEYAVLRQFHQAVTGVDAGTGYHTGRLERAVTDAVADQTHAPVLVCDDLAFLLQSDGLDLLYFLSRLEQPLRLVLASATLPDLQIALGARTYSSLHPRHISLDPYPVGQAADILQRRTDDATDAVLPANMARDVAATTTNIRAGLHWIGRTHDATADGDSLATAPFCSFRQDAVDRYRRDRLAPFSTHHHLLLAAVRTAVASDAEAYTGDIYEQYQQLCQFHDERVLTPRRTSTFLTHLELLNLIDVTHHRGGPTGKTRAVDLVSIQDL